MHQPSRSLRACGLAVIVALAAACSSTDNPAAAAETAAPATPGTACALLPAAEAARILGESVVAKPDNGAIELGLTSCGYFSADGHKFRLTFSYEPHGAATKRAVWNFPAPGAATAEQPYADLGDGAIESHGVLFILMGEAALGIDAPHGKDRHALAARVLQAVRPKL
jgi:hypothetical protein